MDKVVKVRNRNFGYTGYSIPELNINRQFTTKEEKNIPLAELKQLQFIEGGDYILKNCLLINDKSALEELNMSSVEPEYFYTEDEIKILLDTGTLEQLEDTLNFAPTGVIDLIKDLAVRIELPDTRKRKLIAEKTGFSVDNAIKVNTIMNEDTVKEEEVTQKTRKSTPITKPATYKIVSK